MPRPDFLLQSYGVGVLIKCRFSFRAVKTYGSLPQFVPNWVFRVFTFFTLALSLTLTPFVGTEKFPTREACGFKQKGKELEQNISKN
ncbi:MAG: hypothetical protein J1F16_10930 [Muribaculaceae bacterium]|nr:hypothetical protein [Muribaculaceae bacterium]